MLDDSDDHDDDDDDDHGLEKAAGRGGQEGMAEPECKTERQYPTHWYQEWSYWETLPISSSPTTKQFPGKGRYVQIAIKKIIYASKNPSFKELMPPTDPCRSLMQWSITIALLNGWVAFRTQEQLHQCCKFVSIRGLVRWYASNNM